MIFIIIHIITTKNIIICIIKFLVFFITIYKSIINNFLKTAITMKKTTLAYVALGFPLRLDNPSTKWLLPLGCNPSAPGGALVWALTGMAQG
jgi:hypothetical protein